MRPHVLVARQDNNGDVLLTGPAVRAVAAGAGRVTLLCGPRGSSAARLLPGVDEILVAQAEWIDAEPLPLARERTLGLVERLSAMALDEAIVFTSFHQSALPLALLLRLAGVPRVSAISEDYAGSLLDVRHRPPHDVHEVERALSLAAAAGYRLPPGDDGRLAVALGRGRAERPFREPYIVVHPGASVPARTWSPARFAELVDLLVASGRRVVVSGGPDERELCEAVAGPPRPAVVNLAGRTSLRRLGLVLRDAQVLISGNTGPAHLAAAVGTPVVSLFAPTVPPERWRPFGVAHELLFVDVPCAGCRARVCPVPGHPCLEDVATEHVLAAVDRLAPQCEPVEALS